MRRPSHDLPGCAQRLNRYTEQLLEVVDETTQLWQDKRADEFVRQHVDNIRPTVAQVTLMMAKSTELFEDIAKKLSDPERQ